MKYSREQQLLKKKSFRQLQETIDDVKYQENIVLCGDWNSHIGCKRMGYEHNIGAHEVGSRNTEGQWVLDFVKVNNLAVMNSYYQYHESHKWTWYRYSYQLQSYTQRSMIYWFYQLIRHYWSMLKQYHQFHWRQTTDLSWQL